MNLYVRIVSSLSKLGGLIAMLLLAAAVVVVCQMIFMRYVLNASTIWQTEFVIYSLMAATFIGSPYVLMLKGHVGVDLLPTVLPPRARFWLELVAALLSLGFCALLAWSGWTYLEEAWTGGWRTQTVWALPLWIPLLPLPTGIGLLCLQYVAEMIKLRQELEA
ncbi:MAG TPA: TRAP transporter small permease [Hyphomicrobiales bacterium]|nr:TRAP transporter small permease [Hyphomicrobiales bacterium]